MAREAVNRVLTERPEGRLAAVPHAEEFRLQISKNAVEFNELSPPTTRQSSRPPRGRSDLPQGGQHRGTLNLPDDARKTYGLAISLCEKLLNEFAGDFRDQLNLALTLADMGELERITGDLPRAEQMMLPQSRSPLGSSNRGPATTNCHVAATVWACSVWPRSRPTRSRPKMPATRPATRPRSSAEVPLEHPIDGARNALLMLIAMTTGAKPSPSRPSQGSRTAALGIDPPLEFASGLPRQEPSAGPECQRGRSSEH